VKTLFIFDNTISTNKISATQWAKNDMVWLFSMSAKSDRLNDIKKMLTDRGISHVVLASAVLLNESAARVREPYINLIASLPRKVRFNARNLKEWFAIDETLSMWWLSLVSEKNTLKSGSFNKLAQFDAIVQVVREKQVEKIIFGCACGKLKNALVQYARDRLLTIEFVQTEPGLEWWKTAKDLQKLFYFKHLFAMFYFAITFFVRTQTVKQMTRKLNRILPTRSIDKNIKLLCVTYYPSFDITLAEKGVFRNKHYEGIQQSIEAEGKKVTWLCMFVEKSRFSLKESLAYAEKFIKNGHMLVFPEEFNSIKIQIKTLIQMFVCGTKFLRIEKDIARAMNLLDYNCYAIFRDEWYSSFVGSAGYFHLMFYYTWKNILSTFDVKQCLYNCEMHGWEKALILARENLKKNMFLLAYQHTTISPLLLNYFNAPEEFCTNGSYKIPQPDKIICNGEAPFGYMKQSGWPEGKLEIVEAIRYGHLTKYFNSITKKKNIVLLVFSLNVEESSSLLSITYEALHDLEGAEVWIKSHPFLSIDDVLHFAQFKREDLKFQIKNESIEDLLTETRIVIAGQSGVSFEALAFGCELITVDTPQLINMSPLRNIKSEIIWNVSSAQQLRSRVIAILERAHDDALHKKLAGEILDRQFYLNLETDRADRFMNVLEDYQRKISI